LLQSDSWINYQIPAHLRCHCKSNGYDYTPIVVMKNMQSSAAPCNRAQQLGVEISIFNMSATVETNLLL